MTYGTKTSGCRDGATFQFDAGRGTTQQLSKLGFAPPAQRFDALFLTHMHSDHVDGLSELVQLNWQFTQGPPDAIRKNFNIICGTDVVVNAGTPNERTISCQGLLESIDLAFESSGEVTQRYVESLIDANTNIERIPGGPSENINPTYIDIPTALTEDVLAYTKGDVNVYARASAHIGGHLSYKVVTPVGTVVITGDAGKPFNQVGGPSTSPVVLALAQDADILVQSAIHPVFAPDVVGNTFPAFAYARQANTVDIGSLAEAANVQNVMLTHLIPSLGCDIFINNPVIGGPLSEDDYENTVRDGGYNGNVIVGTDLTSLRIPADPTDSDSSDSDSSE